jgi:ABC-type nitrate/sulfonate/bicarbonate transport system substrate-binding protein
LSKNNCSFGKDIKMKAGLFGFSLVFTAFVGTFGSSVVSAPEQLSKVTVTLAPSPSSWPLYIAKEGGYYRQNGLEVNFGFGLHPAPLAMLVSGQAQMTNYTLEQAMQAASRDSSLVIIGSLSKKSLFALIANKTISTVPELKGKRIGISQVGDGPYNYSIKILGRFGLTARDVQWVPIGTNERGAALVSGRIDATMLNAPAYFRLEEAGYRTLANIGDYDDIYTPTVQLYSNQVLAQDPSLPRRLLMSQAQAIERFSR